MAGGLFLRPLFLKRRGMYIPKPKAGRKLKKNQKAMIVALKELGHTKTEITKITGHGIHTIDKYLDEAEAYADPKMAEKVQIIKQKEILDLTVLNVKAK